MWSVHTVDRYSDITGEEVLPAPARMNSEDVMLSEISHTQKGKYHTIPSTCAGTVKFITAEGRLEGTRAWSRCVPV